MDKVTSFFKYIRELLGKVFFYFSLVPTVYDLMKTWLLVQLPPIPNTFLAIFAVLFFIVANLQIYRDKERKINKLNEELLDLEKEEVDYEIIKEGIKGEDLSEDFLNLERQKEKTKKYKNNVNRKLTEMLYGFPKGESWFEYEEEIKKYEEDLIKYKENQKQICKVLFFIKNISDKSDKNLNIVITAPDDCIFIGAYDNVKPDIPEEPSHNIFPYSGSSLMPDISFQKPGIVVREIINHSEKKIEIEIFNLRAKESIKILNDPIICKITGKKTILKFEIKTQHTKNPIVKEIEIYL
ncbi:MAG TPA: hypothetical protein VGO63_02090 [Candidatus Paceibacterota bacterium]|jgi:hypothetical protein|nr:hypothetical protein [Candidatus Paceibacterota bacterium]